MLNSPARTMNLNVYIIHDSNQSERELLNVNLSKWWNKVRRNFSICPRKILRNFIMTQSSDNSRVRRHSTLKEKKLSTTAMCCFLYRTRALKFKIKMSSIFCFFSPRRQEVWINLFYSPIRDTALRRVQSSELLSESIHGSISSCSWRSIWSPWRPPGCDHRLCLHQRKSWFGRHDPLRFVIQCWPDWSSMHRRRVPSSWRRSASMRLSGHLRISIAWKGRWTRRKVTIRSCTRLCRCPSRIRCGRDSQRMPVKNY